MYVISSVIAKKMYLVGSRSDKSRARYVKDCFSLSETASFTWLKAEHVCAVSLIVMYLDNDTGLNLMIPALLKYISLLRGSVRK